MLTTETMPTIRVVAGCSWHQAMHSEHVGGGRAMLPTKADVRISYPLSLPCAVSACPRNLAAPPCSRSRAGPTTCTSAKNHVRGVQRPAEHRGGRSAAHAIAPRLHAQEKRHVMAPQESLRTQGGRAGWGKGMLESYLRDPRGPLFRQGRRLARTRARPDCLARNPRSTTKDPPTTGNRAPGRRPTTHLKYEMTSSSRYGNLASRP